MKAWAFIYTLGSDQDDAAVRTDRIGSPACTLLAVGVPSTAEAAGVIEGLLAEGVELIELCGAFGPAEAALVQGAVGGRVPVGAVSYPASAAAGLHTLFG
jgi:hypothetical protein